jgi:GTP cyclohydrolase I
MAFDEQRTVRAVRDLLAGLGADPDAAELADTPRRVAEFWKERLDGYVMDLAGELKPLPGDLAPCPVILERVPFTSTCEHHLAPFTGLATVGYLPGAGGTVGLSKLVRLVQAFAHRLQVQERMTVEISRAMEAHLRPVAWGVKLVAIHTCMAHRGVRTPEVPVTTLALGGAWRERTPEAFQARAER